MISQITVFHAHPGRLWRRLVPGLLGRGAAAAAPSSRGSAGAAQSGGDLWRLGAGDLLVI